MTISGLKSRPCPPASVLGFILFSAGLGPAVAFASCGELVHLETARGSRLPVSFQAPPGAKKPVTLVLLAGGSGHVKLGSDGCAQDLKGNSLVRSVKRFAAAGFATAVVDAPSDWSGSDGLGGFRIEPAHAKDIGLVIEAARKRNSGPVWVAGTSRGSISAANAAARLEGATAPDGAIITAVLSVGTDNARLEWVRQTVFDLPLDSIRIPILLMGQEHDLCMRSPPAKMEKVASKIPGDRKKVLIVKGGPTNSSGKIPDLGSCAGKSAHGFIGQEAEMVDEMAKFIASGTRP